MLSRIAESLYWMGRYVERADDTARLLDVNVHRALAEIGDEAVGSALLIAMGLGHGIEVGTAADVWTVTELLAYDREDPSSVVGSLRLARENAAGLREVLNTEVWEAMNRTFHDIDQQVGLARDFGPHVLFEWVRERVALIGGLIDNVLLHDDGWRFLTLGRCLERVDMTARLLHAVPPDADDAAWSGVLLSCGANDAFLRTHGGSIDRRRALAVLLLHPDFPRSASFSLRTAEECLRAIQVSADTRRERIVDAPTSDDSTIRTLGRMRSELEYASPVELDRDLGAVLHRIQRACRDASESLTKRYFQRVAFVEWSTEFVS